MPIDNHTDTSNIVNNLQKKSEAQQMGNEVPYGYGYLQPNNVDRSGYVSNILSSIFQVQQ